MCYVPRGRLRAKFNCLLGDFYKKVGNSCFTRHNHTTARRFSPKNIQIIHLIPKIDAVPVNFKTFTEADERISKSQNYATRYSVNCVMVNSA